MTKPKEVTITFQKDPSRLIWLGLFGVIAFLFIITEEGQLYQILSENPLVLISVLILVSIPTLIRLLRTQAKTLKCSRVSDQLHWEEDPFSEKRSVKSFFIKDLEKAYHKKNSLGIKFFDRKMQVEQIMLRKKDGKEDLLLDLTPLYNTLKVKPEQIESITRFINQQLTT